MREFLVYVMWWLSTAIPRAPQPPKRHAVLRHDERGCYGLWLESLTDAHLICIRCQSRVENTPRNQQDAWNENAVGALIAEVTDRVNDGESWKEAA